MKNDGWIGKKGFRYWYYRFRDSEYYSLAVIGITTLICLILLFNVIIPEVTQWFSIRDEVIATRQKIAVLQQNINLMNNLDKNKLNGQLQTASDALPPEKNFGFMLNAISSAASLSNVSLNDFAFQVGNLDNTKGQVTDSQFKGVTSLEITVTINGTIANITRFVKSLENNLPVSQVTAIIGTGQNVAVTIQFYQRPFPTLNYSPEEPLVPLSSDKAELLQTIEKWDNTGNQQTQTIKSGSASAIPLF